MITIINDGWGIAKLFDKYNKTVVTLHGAIPQEAHKPDLVVFTGGTDVNPMYYGENRLHVTGIPDTERDANEALWFSYCRLRKIPMVGICRGAQFGCVMSGGSLYQHVTNHGLYGKHGVITSDGREFGVTSTHHQMMVPNHTNHELLAWPPEPRSKVYIFDHRNTDTPASPEKEAEVVYFRDTDFLAVQYHPEYMHEMEEGVKYFQELVERYCFKNEG